MCVKVTDISNNNINISIDSLIVILKSLNVYFSCKKSLKFHLIILTFPGQNADFVPLSDHQSSVLRNGTIFLNEVDKTNEGMYKCVVSNGIGDQLIKSVMMNVIGMSFLY